MFLNTRLCARWPDYDCKVLWCIFYVYKKKKKDSSQNHTADSLCCKSEQII